MNKQQQSLASISGTMLFSVDRTQKKQRIDCTRLCNVRLSHGKGSNCNFRLYFQNRVVDSCDVRGSLLRHQLCPRRDNRGWYRIVYRLLRLGCALPKLVCDTILADVALFDESIYDGGPVQLLEKRREFGIRTLQPLYMDFLIDRISVPSDSDAWLLQISFECTAACNCVLIADKCALVDKQRFDDTTTQDLAMMAVWDKHTFDGCDTSLLTRSFALPQKGFCDAILLVFDLEEQHSFGDLPFGGLRVIGNGHHLFCARADQLQLLPERRDLFCIPLAHLPPGVYRAPYNYSVTDVAFYKDAPQFPKLLSFDRLSASFRLDAVQRFRSLTVYVQRRALLSTAMSRLAKNK